MTKHEPKTITELMEERKRKLEEINKEHFVAPYAGSVKVYTKETDPTYTPSREALVGYDPHHIALAFANVLIPKEIGKGVENAGRAWMRWPKRRQYKGFVFDPGRDHPGYYNLWQGFAYKPKKGSWRYLKELIEENLGDGDSDQVNFILNWIADMFQRPNMPAEVALAFQGKKGVGKSTLGRVLCRLMGVHALHATSPEHLAGRFNDHLRDLVFLFADEAISPRDRTAEARLKGLITEPTIPIEGKGKDLVTTKNLLHLMISSNENHFLSMSLEDERRYFLARVNESHMNDQAFFTKLHDELENGGYEAMLWDMLQRDITSWRPRNNIPTTSAALEQKVRGMGPLATFVFGLLHEGKLPDPHEGDWLSGPIRMLQGDFKHIFMLWCRDNGIKPGGNGRSNVRFFNDEMVKLFGNGFKAVKMNISQERRLSDIPLESEHDDGRAWAYQLPPLRACRKHMDKLLGGNIDWPAV